MAVVNSKKVGGSVWLITPFISLISEAAVSFETASLVDSKTAQ